MAEVMISVVPAERRRMRLASSVSRRAPKSWEADRYRKLRKPSSWFWVLERSRTRRSRPRRIPSRRASRRPAGGELLDEQLVRLVHPLEGQVAGTKHRLILAVPEVEAVLIDKVLDDRVNEVGDVPVQVHIFPDAGGTDVLQVGRKLKLDDIALQIQLLGAGQGGWPARRKIMRFMEWMDQGRGKAWKQEALPTTSLPTTR